MRTDGYPAPLQTVFEGSRERAKVGGSAGGLAQSAPLVVHRATASACSNARGGSFLLRHSAISCLPSRRPFRCLFAGLREHSVLRQRAQARAACAKAVGDECKACDFSRRRGSPRPKDCLGGQDVFQARACRAMGFDPAAIGKPTPVRFLPEQREPPAAAGALPFQYLDRSYLARDSKL